MEGNPSRERILARVRRALEVPSHQPTSVPNREASLYDLGILAPIDDALDRFQAECEANRTELHLATAENEAALLCDLLSQARLALKSGANSGLAEKDSRAYVQDAPELRRLMDASGAPVRWSSASPPHGSDFAGVTLAEALIARTGSVLVSAGNGGRAASVLPPLHIVYAQISQLVPDLSDAFERVQSSGRVRDVSMLSLITGPSRTSDIEKMLVMGAHGPRRVAILLRV
jgi:L-lactate utilization protein LutC